MQNSTLRRDRIREKQPRNTLMTYSKERLKIQMRIKEFKNIRNMLEISR